MATNVRNRLVVQWALIAIAVAGLAIDVYVHFHLASAYAGVRTSSLSQADLFRAEGAVAAVAAVALVLRPRRYTAAFAFVVAGAGAAAVIVYRYVNVGAFGPFPDMYEPVWYGEKTLSAIAEIVGAVAALAVFALLHAQVRHTPRAARRAPGGNIVRAQH